MTKRASSLQNRFTHIAQTFLDPRTGIAIALGVLGSLAFSIAFLDHPIAYVFGDIMSPLALEIWDEVTDLGKAGPYAYTALGLWIGGRTLMFWTAPHPIAAWYEHIARIGTLFTVSLASSALIVHAMKFIFGRIRPKDLIQNGEYGFVNFSTDWSYNSFPSGHSQTVFVAACIACYVLPRYRWAFLFMAALIAFSRMTVHAHFLSDIILGSYIGIMTVIIIKERWFVDIEQGDLSPSTYKKNTADEAER